MYRTFDRVYRARIYNDYRVYGQQSKAGYDGVLAIYQDSKLLALVVSKIGENNLSFIAT